MNAAATAFADLKTEMLRIDSAAAFQDFSALRAITERHGMRCLDASEDVCGIDQTFRLVSDPFVAELVYLLFGADPGDRDRVTLYLTLLRDDEIVDVLELEELPGMVRA